MKISKKRMTNGDRIRVLSDTDLARFLRDNFADENVARDWFGDTYCMYCYDTGPNCNKCPHGTDAIMAWLKNEDVWSI